jgi:haloacetate dehalogenase
VPRKKKENYRQRIAVCLWRPSSYTREVMQGFSEQAANFGDWQLERFKSIEEMLSFAASERTPIHGIVAVFSSEAEVERVRRALPVPTVNVTSKVAENCVPSVMPDDASAAAMAAEHFLALGLRHFAFCGVTGFPFSEERWRGFRTRLAQTGRVADRFLYPSLEAVEHPAPADGRALAAWLARKECPVGVLAAADFIGQNLLQCCERLRLSVPQDVAIVSLGYEEVEHSLSPIKQTHVLFANHEIGVRAARLLRDLLGGAPPPIAAVRVAPLRLVEAQSSSVTAVTDRQLDRAVRFIRAHYAESLTVTHIAQHSGIGRRTLEKRFRGVLGHSPKEELDRVRLARVRELLVGSDDTLDAIAARVGLQDAKHLSCFFSKHEGIAPGRYRQRANTLGSRPHTVAQRGGAAIDGFASHAMKVGDVTLECEVGGSGPPVLLLHGFPQDRCMWRKVAPSLAKSFTVVCADLRGYGGSDAPPGGRRHEAYSKRVMAHDQFELMRLLAFDRFAVVGHDSGGRVAHRLALDHPGAVERLVMIDLVPTTTVFETAGSQLAHAYYHWFFLSQPFDMPERLVGTDPGYYVLSCLERWSGSGLSPFGYATINHYRSLWQSSERIHASCEDFRATATIDLEHDRDHSTKTILCPLHVLWGERSVTSQLYQVLDVWRSKARGPVTGRALPCGHFVPEECPDECAHELRDFLLRPIA